MATPIPVTRASSSRLTEALRENSEFGATFSDHMFVADWEAGSWKQPQIVPFGPISFSPALTPFHYGQAIFEGFKAHRTANAGIALFRPRDNFARMNRSATRLAMPEIPEPLPSWFASIVIGFRIVKVALFTSAQRTLASTTPFSFAPPIVSASSS
jgi:branched-chain amino acid aminotransferase